MCDTERARQTLSTAGDSPRLASLEHKDARGNVTDQPHDAVDEAGASDGRARLDVAVPIQHELVESEHGRDVGQREGAREILLVGKDEERGAGELLGAAGRRARQGVKMAGPGTRGRR